MDTNLAVAQRWFREVWVDGGETTVDALLTPETVGMLEGQTVHGAEAYKVVRQDLLDTFPDLEATVDAMIADGDQVAVRWSVKATHRGPGLGIPPTNRPVAFRGMTWLEMRDGKIVRGWDSWNLGGLVQSLTEP
jgi:steroid delta-isomerase-like uncharacterized protein